MTDEPLSFETVLGTSTSSTITLLGRDLASDLMGQFSLTEITYWMVTERKPSRGQTRLLDACLLALADHGFTPTAIAARLTYLSAPDSLQGAMAAGILGGGSRFLGVTEDCGRFLADEIARLEEPPADDAGWDAVALELVQRTREAGAIIPGLGHHVHKLGDPRTPVIIGIAKEEGEAGSALALFEAVGRVHSQVIGKRLPLNGAGVVGAALVDLGIPCELLRGIALVARAAGILGQLAEERRRPMAMATFLEIDGHAIPIKPADGS
jgi:citrate synthase